MKKVKNIITLKGLMRWLIEAMLVFGLIIFSGHISEFKSYGPERLKTELKKDVSLSNLKRTAFFQKIYVAYSCSFWGQQSYGATSHISCLLHYECNIKVKLSVSKIVATQSQEKNFLRHHNFHNSKQSDSDNQRG